MTKLISAALFLWIAISSCTKAEDQKTAHDTLRAGKWRQSEGSVRFQGREGIDTTTNYFPDTLLVVRCVRDNYLVFKENISGVVDEGPQSCNVGDPQERAFTWEIQQNGEKLNIFNAEGYFHTASVYSDILSISENSLSIKYVVYEQQIPGDIDTLTYTSSFTKF